MKVKEQKNKSENIKNTDINNHYYQWQLPEVVKKQLTYRNY